MFEVKVLYKGQDTYFVTAKTKSEAEEEAIEMYGNGDLPPGCAHDWEEIERTVVSTIPKYARPKRTKKKR